MHERIRKERGEEHDAAAVGGGNGSGYDYSSGDGENGVVGKKPEWNLDEMDDE